MGTTGGRGDGIATATASASAAEGAPSAKAEAAIDDDVESALPELAETRRRLAIDPRSEPMLLPHLPGIREHFGDGVKVDLQALRLAEARTAVLLSAGDKHLILAIDQGKRGEASSIAWTKDRPLAGTFRGATELALATGPHGEVNLAWFDPTTKAVALRRWRFDGLIEADWMLGKMDDCDAISATYWPRQGWLVAASNLGTARLFLLDKGGTLRWKGGIGFDSDRATRAPLTLLPDSSSSVIVAGVGTARSQGRHADEHVLATRLDAEVGEALWDAVLDLGPAVPRTTWVEGHVLAPGRVAVGVGPGRTVEVASSGATKPR